MLQRTFVRRAALVATAALAAACQDAAPTDPAAPSLDRSARAQERLEAKFKSSSPEVLDLPGTVFADNDETRGRLVFGVDNMGAARAVQKKLEELGVAEDEYAIELTAPIQFAATLRDRFRPTIAGTQIHFGNFLCTLGYNVDQGSERSFITNSHCTNTQGGVEGTQYFQPLSSTDPTVIATEVEDPIYRKNIAGCSRGKKCRSSDASRALYSGSVASNRGEVARTTGVNTGSLDVAGIFTVTSQDNTTDHFAIGTTVNKVGRTTGWTRGNVTNTCVTTNVSGSTVQLLCQTFVQDPGGANVVGSGDSGSGVWIDQGGGNVKAIGLLWGGSSDNKLFVFSPLKNIQDEIGGVNAVK